MEKINWPKVFEYDEIIERPWDDVSYSEEWHRYQYGYLKQYCIKILSGWSICQCFDGVNAEEIALYAATDFAELAASDLKRFTQKTVTIADKNPEKYGNSLQGMKILSKEEMIELYKVQKVKQILVCSFFSANSIMQELLDAGIDLDDLRTITSVLVS